MTHRTINKHSYHGATSRSPQYNKVSGMYYPVCDRLCRFPLPPMTKSLLSDTTLDCWAIGLRPTSFSEPPTLFL